MKLAEKLNLYGVFFNLTKEEGVSLESCPEDDSLFDSEGNVVDKAFETFLDELDTYKAYVDYDPRDRRCGLVVYVETATERAWYDESGASAWDECGL